MVTVVTLTANVVAVAVSGHGCHAYGNCGHGCHAYGNRGMVTVVTLTATMGTVVTLTATVTSLKPGRVQCHGRSRSAWQPRRRPAAAARSRS
eukprot:251238-Rhodomonas_salina.1